VVDLRGPLAQSSVPPLSHREARSFARLERQWLALGSTAPDWAIRRVPGAPEGGANSDQFLSTGVEEVDRVAARARELNVPLGGDLALDFGCGPGRMTQALARHFQHVTGADVSPEMVALARNLNRLGDRCDFVHSPTPDLRSFETGTFATTFSVYVLQHLPHWLMRRYLREFVRVTRPGGTIVFQVHGGLEWRFANLFPEAWVSAAYQRLRRRPARHAGQEGAWEVHWISPRLVRSLLVGAGATVRSIDRLPELDGHLASYWYFATKSPS
jgi:SAM-dependent methyltransferase